MKKILGLLMMMGLMVSFGGCEGPMGPTGEEGRGWDNLSRKRRVIL